MGVAVDITERKQLQDQLRQAQKMEAVGRLAGGVAHDFNNLLTVISGYSSFLLESLPDGSSLRSYAEQVSQAATRAAQLTAKLLAFGLKQMLQPRIMDVNALVLDAETMLRRLIGEDVQLVTDLQPRIGCILADPGQVYQVVLNLVVNARDAMPRGGRITISTVNVTIGEDEARHEMEIKPGDYIMLAVCDTGHGMSRETLAHMFEPFFTTKEVGRGTGLGLSTAYGIVKQSGGHISVESELGHGSTFRVYLPRAQGTIEGETAANAAAVHGSETVLLVEDEELVRQFARSALEQAGYKVIEAANGQEALRRIQDGTHPDLVLTDVVMPEMDGCQLAERVTAQHPRTQVLFMSGYAASVLAERGIAGAPPLLQKPFTALGLTSAVRQALDTPPFSLTL
jgi:nitrogen-specific signal transduction histidine kinase